MIGKPIEQSISIDKIGWLVSIGIGQSMINWWPHKNSSSIAIDWHSNLEQTSRMLPARSSAIFRKPWGWNPTQSTQCKEYTLLHKRGVRVALSNPNLLSVLQTSYECFISWHTHTNHELQLTCKLAATEDYCVIMLLTAIKDDCYFLGCAYRAINLM